MGVSDVHLWIRSETRPTEQRVPIVPADAARLLADGVRVTVEESPTRAFSIADFRAAGCEIAAAGAWEQAPDTAYVVGIKELPDRPVALRHTHIFFAHAFKRQEGAAELLSRFTAGGGELLDVEFLTERGRRVVAFGHWAGYVGASLGVLVHRGELAGPVAPATKVGLDHRLAHPVAPADGRSAPLRALVIGAAGRSGRGAVEALEVAGCTVTRWGVRDTRVLDKEVLLAHDLLVSCVVTTAPQPVLVDAADLVAHGRRLSVIADVTCDVTSEHNLLPINTAVTTWAEPVRRVYAGDPGTGSAPVDVIAIDNLPSLLPREASVGFSAELTPLVSALATRSGPWASARAAFRQAVTGERAGEVRA